MKDPPTRDFARWDGTKFIDKKTKSRPGNPGHGGPEIRATGGPEIRPPRRQSGPENRAIQTEEGGPEIRAISKLPSPGVLPASSSSISSPTPRPRPSEARPHSAVASEAGPPLRRQHGTGGTRRWKSGASMNGRVARGSLNDRWRPQDDRRPNVQGVLTLEHFLPAGTRVHVAGRSRMAAGVGICELSRHRANQGGAGARATGGDRKRTIQNPESLLKSVI